MAKVSGVEMRVLVFPRVGSGASEFIDIRNAKDPATPEKRSSNPPHLVFPGQTLLLLDWRESPLCITLSSENRLLTCRFIRRVRLRFRTFEQAALKNVSARKATHAGKLRAMKGAREAQAI